MPSQTAHLGLTTWVESDPFKLSDFVHNLSVLDGAPGITICTSTTRPGMAGGPAAWGANQHGMSIYETDSDLIWRWNGSAFVRLYPRGLLGAPTSRTVDISTTSVAPAFVQALSASVTVPAGGRSVLLAAELPVIQSTGAVTAVGLFRDNLSSQLTAWAVQGDLLGTAADQPRNGSGFFVDTPTSGAHTYIVGFAAQAGFPGTAYVRGSAAQPAQLSVIEV